jgi:putative oxidoreductase
MCIIGLKKVTYTEPKEKRMMKVLIGKYRGWMETGAERVCLDVGLLIGRVSFGGMMLFSHGLPKMQKYSEVSEKFPDPLGVGSPVSMALAIFGEVFCSVLVMIGVGTRLAATQLIATMVVAAFLAHSGDPFFAAPGERSKEFALVYLTGFLLIFLAGPGRYSVDAIITRIAKKDAKCYIDENKNRGD